MVPQNSPPENPKPKIRDWLGITATLATCLRLLLEVMRVVR